MISSISMATSRINCWSQFHKYPSPKMYTFPNFVFAHHLQLQVMITIELYTIFRHLFHLLLRLLTQNPVEMVQICHNSMSEMPNSCGATACAPVVPISWCQCSINFSRTQCLDPDHRAIWEVMVPHLCPSEYKLLATPQMPNLNLVILEFNF